MPHILLSLLLFIEIQAKINFSGSSKIFNSLKPNKLRSQNRKSQIKTISWGNQNFVKKDLVSNSKQL